MARPEVSERKGRFRVLAAPDASEPLDVTRSQELGAPEGMQQFGRFRANEVATSEGEDPARERQYGRFRARTLLDEGADEVREFAAVPGFSFGAAPEPHFAEEAPSLQELQRMVLEQRRAFEKACSDMTERVMRASANTRPSTPCSGNTASSSRTQPRRQFSMPSVTGPGIGEVESRSPRERTLQTWCSLGSRLDRLVRRNEQLERENSDLAAQLRRLDEQLAALPAHVVATAAALPAG